MHERTQVILSVFLACLKVIIFSDIHFPANDVASFFFKTPKLEPQTNRNKKIPNRID